MLHLIAVADFEQRLFDILLLKHPQFIPVEQKWDAI